MTPPCLRSGTRPDRGFTLLELLIAFGILALTMGSLIGIQGASISWAAQAIERRDTSVMADTVFRRIVYEVDKHQDGETGTADVMYGEYIQLEGAARDRWKDYRLLVRKRRGMVVGTDPTGKLEDLFTDTGATSGSSSSSSSSRTGGSSSGTGSGSGSGSSETEPTSGEEAYLVELDVFFGEETETPVLTLKSVVPIPPSEEEAK